MAVTTLQSNLVPLNVSADGGSTYKAVVCKKSWSFNGDSSSSEEQTDCGTLLGLGSTTWGFDIEGVINTTPGASEVSAETMFGYWNSQTALKVKLDYPASAGTDLYAVGDCYLTSFKIQNTVGNLMTFTGSLKGTGALDITP